MSSKFIEPAEMEGTSSSARLFSDLLNQKCSEWLCSILKHEYLLDDDLQSEEHRSILMLFRKELADCTSCDLVLLKYWLIFHSKYSEQICDREKLAEARAAFSWKDFFSVGKNRTLFFLQHPLVNSQCLLSNQAGKTAWKELPANIRAECYESDYFKQIRGLAEKVEGIPDDVSVPFSQWHNLPLGSRFFISYCRILNGKIENIEVTDIPSLLDPAEFRFAFLGIVTNETASTLSLLYQNVDFELLLRDICSYLLQNENLSNDQKSVFWQFLINRAESDGLAAKIIMLQALIPIADGYKNHGIFNIATKNLVEQILAILFQPDVFQKVVDELEKVASNQVQINSFHRLLLKQISKRMIKFELPVQQTIRIFALWFRFFDNSTNAENIPALPDSKILYKIIISCIQTTGSLEALLTVPGFDQLNFFEQVTWYAALIRAAGLAVCTSERNVILSETFTGNSNYYVHYLYDNPLMDYFKPILTKQRINYVTDHWTNGDDDSLTIFALALALNNEDARIAFQSQRQYDSDQLHAMAYLQAVYALSFSSPDLSTQYINSLIEGEKFSKIPLALMDYLHWDEREIFNYACKHYLKKMYKEPNASDFWFRVEYPRFAPKFYGLSSLQSDKQNVPDFILEKVIELLDKPQLDGRCIEEMFALELADLAVCYSLPESDLFQSFKTNSLKAAQQFFDTFRKAVRENASWETTGVKQNFLDNATMVISCLRSDWAGIKQLLLIFRHMTAQAIDTDLNHYYVGSATSWSIIAQDIHKRLARNFNEQKGRELRQEMTHDLLEFLKPRKDDPKKTPKEPDENWRYAYIRAIADLGADPKGEKHFHHQVLDKCAENDPSPMVREAAKRASEKLKTRTGWRSGSSKRILLNAWWWIRQAHLLSLGVELDQQGALKRRETEIRI